MQLSPGRRIMYIVHKNPGLFAEYSYLARQTQIIYVPFGELDWTICENKEVNDIVDCGLCCWWFVVGLGDYLATGWEYHLPQSQPCSSIIKYDGIDGTGAKWLNLILQIEFACARKLLICQLDLHFANEVSQALWYYLLCRGLSLLCLPRSRLSVHT